jgi:hypothetical protein
MPTDEVRMQNDEPSLLARAVIARALSDAGIGADDGIRRAITALERAQAVAFLTADGAWARSRSLWCGLADLDPDNLRQRALSMLAGFQRKASSAPQPVAQHPSRRRPRPGTKFAALYDQLCSAEGVDVSEAAARFSWKRDTVFSYMMSDMPQKLGIKPQRCNDGRYRFVQDTPRAA